MDVNRALRTAAQTGDVRMGIKETEQAVASGKAKLVVLAANIPKDAAERIKTAARTKNVAVYEFGGPNSELGPACGKPYSVASLSVVEAGESDVLALARVPK
ncbi:MAG TPA: 50S ribosomal protein L30e [Candidatus Thermoplasmatota archaeon]|nr:50S ribosomal protein L30e [Candidatus Thermoplasmatota archaeon]